MKVLSLTAIATILAVAFAPAAHAEQEVSRYVNVPLPLNADVEVTFQTTTIVGKEDVIRPHDLSTIICEREGFAGQIVHCQADCQEIPTTIGAGAAARVVKVEECEIDFAMKGGKKIELTEPKGDTVKVEPYRFDKSDDIDREDSAE